MTDAEFRAYLLEFFLNESLRLQNIYESHLEYHLYQHKPDAVDLYELSIQYDRMVYFDELFRKLRFLFEDYR